MKKERPVRRAGEEVVLSMRRGRTFVDRKKQQNKKTCRGRVSTRWLGGNAMAKGIINYIPFIVLFLTILYGGITLATLKYLRLKNVPFILSLLASLVWLVVVPMDFLGMAVFTILKNTGDRVNGWKTNKEKKFTKDDISAIREELVKINKDLSTLKAKLSAPGETPTELVLVEDEGTTVEELEKESEELF